MIEYYDGDGQCPEMVEAGEVFRGGWAIGCG
jgi:hypothetical protein